MLFTNWMKISGDAAMLGIEMQQVMHLRMMKLFAGGPRAQSEAFRMVTEKTTALAEATMTLARGGSAQRVIRPHKALGKAHRRWKSAWQHRCSRLPKKGSLAHDQGFPRSTVQFSLSSSRDLVNRQYGKRGEYRANDNRHDNNLPALQNPHTEVPCLGFFVTRKERPTA